MHIGIGCNGYSINNFYFFFLENKSLPYNAVLLQSPCEANSRTIESYTHLDGKGP